MLYPFTDCFLVLIVLYFIAKLNSKKKMKQLSESSSKSSDTTSLLNKLVDKVRKMGNEHERFREKVDIQLKHLENSIRHMEHNTRKISKGLRRAGE